MDWLGLLAAGIAGSCINEFFNWRQKNKHMPYKWVCPVDGCGFSTASNSEFIINQAQTTHKHYN